MKMFRLKRNRFRGKTVVITGASSGLGRAAALEFARNGARLGLIARSTEGLGTLASEVRILGGQAITCSVDVTDAAGLAEAARTIARRFGGIDVWVNNAGIALYGELDKTPLSELHRVMDVNFFGQVNGARAALPYLEAAPEGRLIGITSVLAEAAVPLQAVYTASKHALYGMYKSLQQELWHRHSRVRVSTVLIPSLSTPLFDHAKTYLGYRPKPVAPIYPPERYARLIVKEAMKPHIRSLRGGFGRFAVASFRYLPELSNRFEARTGYGGQRSRDPKGAFDGDNLFAPMPGLNTVRGSTRPSRLVVPLESLGKALFLVAAAETALRLLRRTSFLPLRSLPMPAVNAGEDEGAAGPAPERESA